MKTVDDRVEEYGPAADARWAPAFAAAGVDYPPAEVVLVGLKEERMLEVWARAAGAPFRLVRTLPILGCSGTAGPKLRQGDRQVPEGLYRIESLNPNSRYHLALRVNYPNDHDRRIAAAEKRKRLGGDIMIHGGSASIGCLAMGDEAAEDLFVLAARAGADRVRVILSPYDLRARARPDDHAEPRRWVRDLYAEVQAALHDLAR